MYQIDLPIKTSFCTAIHSVTLLSRNISNYNDVRQAVYDVYQAPSIIARRMTGRKKISGSIFPLLENISKRIFDYFNGKPNTPNSQANYDKFFYGICEYFKDEYNNIARYAFVPEIEFGISQKLINMIFKYLSCYRDYGCFDDLFAYCHIPIDSYILHYFNTNKLVTGIRSCFRPAMRSPSAYYNGTSWSKLSKEEYQSITHQYRSSLFGLYPDFTFLHLEFYFWFYTSIRTPHAPIVFFHTRVLSGTKTAFHI